MADNPISTHAVSSFGSYLADAPGLFRENGFTKQFTVSTSGADGSMVAICSSTAAQDVTQFQAVLAPLGPGDSLNIFSISCACASNTDPMVIAVKPGSKGDDATNDQLMVASANRNGPWFQHFELPIRIDGPDTGTKDVYVKIITKGATAGDIHKYNTVNLGIIEYRRPGV